MTFFGRNKSCAIGEREVVGERGRQRRVFDRAVGELSIWPGKRPAVGRLCRGLTQWESGRKTGPLWKSFKSGI